LLWIGGGIAFVGLAIRAWAAGYIRKDRELATQGPYAHVRNPLYVGSFLLAMGVIVAGGQWIFAVAFGLFYTLVYGRTVRVEAELLAEKFGESYRTYAAHVPLLWPRITPARFERAQGGRTFESSQYWKNREYEAALGLVAGLVFLTAKMIWWP